MTASLYQSGSAVIAADGSGRSLTACSRSKGRGSGKSRSGGRQGHARTNAARRKRFSETRPLNAPHDAKHRGRLHRRIETDAMARAAPLLPRPAEQLVEDEFLVGIDPEDVQRQVDRRLV